MPINKQSLRSDPRYKAFVKRYVGDIERFSVEVLCRVPTWQQSELFVSVGLAGSRTSIASGHGTGKTSSIGVVSLWHLLCYRNSNTLLTAPKISQLKDQAWKEIADLKENISRGPHAWIADYIMIFADRIYIDGHKEGWFIIAKTAPKGSPENLAGMHRDWYLLIADEASGIPDENYGVLMGATTDKRNRVLLTSQPTRNVGFFYDTHHKMSRWTLNADGRRGSWTNLVFSSEESPLVSDDFIREKLELYGSRDDPQYQIKVLGKFPEMSSEYLLSRREVEARIGAEPVIGPNDIWGYILSVDVAAGENRDYSVATLARVAGQAGDPHNPRRVDVVDILLYTNTKNIEAFSNEVRRAASQYEDCTVLVDAVGMGIAVAQKLEALGVPNVYRVKWGKPCWSKRLSENYTNQRSQCTENAAKAIKNGQLSFLTSTRKKDLLDQASRIPYGFDSKGRYAIASKDEMRSKNIPSPDIFDTICQFFLEDAHFIQHESIASMTNNRRSKLVSDAGDAFAELD